MNRQKMFGCIICLLVGILMFSACQNEDFGMGGDKNEGDMVYFGLNLPSMDEVVVSRAEANDMEKAVYTVYALAFDSNENCFYKQEIYNGYAEKKPYSSSQALGIPKQTGNEYESCTVWIIANVGAETGVAAGSFDFSQVSTLDELKETYAYRLLQTNASGGLIQRDCIPMTGEITGVNMTTPTSISSPHEVTMERILAKVSFTVNVTDPDLEFYFNNWTVESLPRYTYVIPHEVEDITTKPSGVDYSLYFPSNSDEENLITYGVGGQWIQQGSPSKTYGFYMYENRRGERRTSPYADNLYGEVGDYADDIKNQVDNSGENPKFKTLYAPENASFIILTGVIRDKNTKNVTSFAYKIALGANNYNDYNIERDHNYVYNINIGGVSYDDITVNAFDSRVHKAYALQVSAPYSEQIDAHYDKRYLDILASPGKLELQFYPTQEDAEAGTNAMSNTNPWIVLSEEDTYNIDIDPDEGTSKTYTLADTEHKEYFIYTQENLSTTSRSAILKVTHTPAEGSSEVVQEPVVRYYTFTQAGLIEVDGVYVESYEEYGMNLDPYSSEQAVQGLQWGWSGTEINVYDTANGLGNTSTIINTSGNPGDFVAGSIYQDYAARYCDYKNKRDASGNIVEHNWYLPAIDELKPLTSLASTNMKGKIYWSSSVPTDNEVTTNPFQERYENAGDLISKGFWAVIYLLWEGLLRDIVEDPNSEYYYTKVAKSAQDGVEAMDKKGEQSGYDISTYYQRISAKYVRAVRKKP